MVQLTPQHPYVTLRLKFKKVGSLQYISHLDLVRTMSKIITRAKLPLWYTESVCEFLDIRLIDDPSAEEVKARLNANMTDEMQVIEAYYTEDKLTDLKWLAYSMDIKTDGASEELAEACRTALLGEKVIVTKKAKPREEAPVVDIRPLIKEISTEYKNGMIHIDALLSADASSFLNPEYVVKALKTACGILSNPDLTKEYYSIMRTAAYKADMTEFK